MKQRAHQFIKYVNKVYGLSQQLFGFSDGRTNPQVSLQKILKMIYYSGSLYAKAQVINEIVAKNKIAVIRVKQENYNIIKDADGLFADREPDLGKELSLKSS